MTERRQKNHHKIDRDSMLIINHGLRGMKKAPGVPEISILKSTLRLRQADVELISHKMQDMDDETKSRAGKTIKLLEKEITKLCVKIIAHDPGADR